MESGKAVVVPPLNSTFDGHQHHGAAKPVRPANRKRISKVQSAMQYKLGWSDLLIQEASLDFETLLDDWRWLLNGRFRVVAGSKFGDWFVERPEGQVELLDSIEGAVHLVADSTAKFYELINTQERQEEWLLSPLVLTLHEKGVVPGSGECYGFKMPPVLGGEVRSDNVEIMDLNVWVSICGQIHEQVHALPAGTRIAGFKTEPE